ncbi:hypothetical protein EVAR_69587_1 [Eumeta japonica]|uniref:Uncharacterized protein n=1 Tax=Eumeta variegata TaxID=151549 RepID=A0A4C1ZVT4_EUMVA|nr:hypothetical protein EVAR_69587_1 [Eumeta japonica]
MEEESVSGHSCSEDDISVGRPSPAPSRSPSPAAGPHDYFGPLKRLKMSSEPGEERRGEGVKSFSILDILSHRPRTPPRIVRPWDACGAGLERLQRLQRLAGAALLDGERWRLAALGLLRPGPRDDCCDSASERSSSASDCCSEPRRAPPPPPAPHTPLDALFHMTSKTFEANTSDNGGRPKTAHEVYGGRTYHQNGADGVSDERNGDGN